MNTNTAANSQHFFARLAGLSYVVFTVAGLILNFALNTKLVDFTSTQSSAIFQNEMHFRLGIAAEIVMFLGVVMASVCFYIVLKPVNKPMAQTALCLRLIEIITGGLAVVVSMTMLALSTKAYFLKFFDQEQLHAIVVAISSLRVPAYEYSWIAMGLAGIITFYLFFKTRYIPRAWAVWGMITYSSLVLYPLAKLLIADLPREVMFVLFPGALFELGVGIWLMTKGINTAAANTTAQ
ncbi:hypothetical protein GCM10011369_14170 [Neiella marina]|uniref:DUF4386 domain-containing protein n=2 Tax=Neiella marina TaxID=508461 RepID=A0A8J2U483_9GAMM|nr:DUF4386 domain-containing protein [Neiella marina]GGA73570.1 hypothetical protein GCM10011369_14170 [Neiella marina]